MQPPDDLRQALAARGAGELEGWREHRRAYARTTGDDGPLFVRWSDDPADRPVLAHEARVRGMIGATGTLRCPPVLEGGERWLIERAVAAERPAGAATIALLLDAVADLEQRALPTLPPTRAPRRAAVRRRARSLRALGPHAVAARRVLARSDMPVVTGHGDLHTGNVLAAPDGPWIVDWELTGRYPAGLDLMQLWATLEEPADRDALWAGALAHYGAQRERSLARVRYALVVRTIVAKLAAEASFNVDPEGARRLRTLLPAVAAAAR